MAKGSDGRRVAVFGGGPAGMTVAHELAERGFEVDLYERHEMLGGKCRSYAYPGTGTDGRADLPANLGGHFFGGFYSGVLDTLSRIPTGDGRTVLDNLTTSARGLGAAIAWGDPTPRLIPTASAGSVTPLALLKRATKGLKGLRTFPYRDVLILASKSVALVTSGEKRQWDQLEHLVVDEYFHIDQLSANARKIATAVPGFRGAPALRGTAQADGLNARVFGRVVNVGVNSLSLRSGLGVKDKVWMLNGPETEVWFDPWARYLESRGTQFHIGHAVTSLPCEGGRITNAMVRDQTERESRIEADWYVLAVPPERAAALMSDDLVAADPALGRIAQLQTYEGVGLQLYLNKKVPELRTLFAGFNAPWPNWNEVLTSKWNLDLAHYGDGKAAEFLSIGVTEAGWEYLPGMLYGKPAKDCTLREIIDELLAQLRHYLPDGERLFADEAIHSVYLNPMMISGGDDATCTVDEPFYVPSRSSWRNQPEPVTKIPNFFLAGSYTRGNRTDYECMEGANESGRRAANGVLDASGVPAAPVDVPTYSVPRALKLLHRLDDRRYDRGLPNAFDVVARWPFRLRSRPTEAVERDLVETRAS